MDALEKRGVSTTRTQERSPGTLGLASVATTGRMVITDMDTGRIMVMAIDATAGAISWEPRAKSKG